MQYSYLLNFIHQQWEASLHTHLLNLYTELKKLDFKMLINPIKKWVPELNREFSTEEVQMAKRHLRPCSTSLAIREMQIKTTLRYHLTPVRMAKIKNTFAGEDV